MYTPKAIKTLPISLSSLASLAGLNPTTFRRKIAQKEGYTLTVSNLRALLVVVEELESLCALIGGSIKQDILELLKNEYEQDYEGQEDVSIL